MELYTKDAALEMVQLKMRLQKNGHGRKHQESIDFVHSQKTRVILAAPMNMYVAVQHTQVLCQSQ